MLEPLELVAIAIAFGCPTWVLSKLIDHAFGGKRKQAQRAAADAQDHVRALELRLLDARRQNHQLQQQLDWHTRMLKTQAAQDRPVTQLTTPSAAPTAVLSHAAPPAAPPHPIPAVSEPVPALSGA